jgi:hypothetical protein
MKDDLFFVLEGPNPPARTLVTVSPEELKNLKKLCKSHKKGEIFTWKGKEILKDYGDYLIEYIESLLRKK